MSDDERARLLWERDVARTEARKARAAQREAENLLDYARQAIDAEYQRAQAALRMCRG